MNKYKRILSVFLVALLVSVQCLSYKKQEVYAVDLTDPVIKVGMKVIIAATVTAGGVILKTKDDLNYVNEKMWKEIKKVEHYENMFRVGVVTAGVYAGKKVLSLTATGVNWFTDTICKIRDTDIDVDICVQGGSVGDILYSRYLTYPVDFPRGDTSKHLGNVILSGILSFQFILPDGEIRQSTTVKYDNVTYGRMFSFQNPYAAGSPIVVGFPDGSLADRYRQSYEFRIIRADDLGDYYTDPRDILENWNKDVAVPRVRDVSVPYTPSVDGSITTDIPVDDILDKSWDDVATTFPLDTDIDTDTDTDTDTTTDTPYAPDLSVPTDVSLNFKPLELNLSEKFPFCVPFDLIRVIKSFKAEREIPSFNVKFEDLLYKTSNESYNMKGGGFKIDFKKFSKIAAILRYFLLINFLIGLIKLTRNMIKG